MDKREEELLEHGAIKLFFIPEEIALLISCLNWVKVDLAVAAENLNKLSTPSGKLMQVLIAQRAHLSKNQVPKELFTLLLSPIDQTIEHIIVGSIAHFDENGKANLRKTVDEIEQKITSTHQYEELVTRMVLALR